MSETARLNVESARQVMLMVRGIDGPPEDVAMVRDIVITTRAGSIRGRCYLGRTRTEPAPVLVWFHGGGFVMGDLDSADGICRRLANRTDALVLSVEYRLAPEHPAPAATDDAWDALLWTVEHAEALGADRTRVAVGGDSAGGNLAAVVALRARDEGGPELRHQLLVYPATDLARESASHAENAAGMFDPAAVTWFYELYIGDQDENDPRLSPAAVADLSGLPPAFIITAGHDPLRDEGQAYAARLAAAGVEVAHEHYPEMLHGFFQMAGVTPTALDATDLACAYVRGALETN